LVYNWWTIFMRLGIPDKHAEAITSRPFAHSGEVEQHSGVPRTGQGASAGADALLLF
jgi:hypothetical protein